MAYAVLVSLTMALVYAMSYHSAVKAPLNQKDINGKSLFSSSYIKYAVLLAFVFLTQLVIACNFSGHKNDIALFKLWTSFGEEHKIWEYYQTEHYVDYPPVYLYILYTMGKIAALLGVEKSEPMYLFFVKFVPILCDSILTAFIFKFAKGKIGDKKAFVLACLTAFNPAVIYNSSFWGQCDSFVTLILIAMLFALYNKKTIAACALFALGFMTKPQMIIYAPLVFFTVLSDFCHEFKMVKWQALKEPLLGFLAFCAVILIIPLLITGGDYSLLLTKLKEAVGLYPYASLNAPNLYGALGLNWIKSNEMLLFLPIKAWGFSFIVLISLIVAVLSFKVAEREKVFFGSAFTTVSIFMLAHTMHERYIYSALLVFVIIFVITKDKRPLFCFFGFSVTLFISEVMALLANNEERFIMSGDKDFVPFIILSFINLVIFAFMLLTWHDILINKRKKPAFYNYGEKNPKKMKVKKEKPAYEKNTAGIKLSEKSAVISKKDIKIMAAITLIYAFTAFFALGSANVPETGYMPKTAEETVTLDLGKQTEIKRIYLYSGWIARRKSDSSVKREITVSVSSDGESFTELDEKLQVKSVFKWHHLDIDEEKRYVKLSFDEPDFYINEVVLFGDSEAEKREIVKVLSANDTARFLADEQQKAKYNYTWHDGTYFDEIYHPRTAYEHITNRYPYENTHPPLGKVIIALGMLIFGVNPFGWRFFGCLAGVIMVPVMYIFAKKMFKSSFWACICTLLFTFDFMHLAQTRLATVDSFVVLFIMCSYLFMFMYIEKSIYDTEFKKTLVPLFFSGLFFGFSVSTKWQGFYAGAGLAFVFAVYLIKRINEFLWAKNERIVSKEHENALKNGKKLIIKTVFFAFVFFVIIPAVIYFLSYIPAMSTPDTGIKFFFKNQGQMLSYHANLSPEKSHPYSSPWWSWPLDLKPLYAYGPDRTLLSEEFTQKIASFGNPAVWWMTIPTMIALIWCGIKKGFDNKLLITLAGFAAMYLPWAFISREAFIYHFFPCVMFVCMGIVYLLKMFHESKKIKKRTVIIYVSTVIILFFVFYPLLTGMVVPTGYAKMLRWLGSWPF